MTKFYTGIGSRSTPATIQAIQKDLAGYMEACGYTLRSGGAQGADRAFESGVTIPRNKEIYMPWSGFNGYTDSEGIVDTPNLNNYHEAVEIAAQIHPAWERLTRGPRALHIRNVYQVLGQDLQTPSRVLLCWAEYQGSDRQRVKGGTNTAVQLALHHNVPVINLYGAPNFTEVLKKLTPHLQ